MKQIKLTMINEDIHHTPRLPLKAGFAFRPWQGGDEQIWAELETQAGEFASVDEALTRFRQEFAGYEEELASRCVILQTREQEPVGTVMGWYDKGFADGSYGRLHWVSIKPAYQGQGLARPLVTEGIQLMKPHHTKAYLTTQTTSYKGIKLYLDYGF